ncbi:MAG: hypothetical protein ACI87E_001171, partial [Mariniblastus sp.]
SSATRGADRIYGIENLKTWLGRVLDDLPF